jgi:hypothetical protein
MDTSTNNEHIDNMNGNTETTCSYLSNTTSDVQLTRTMTNLTEIDENEFIYDEPSPYASVAHSSFVYPNVDQCHSTSYTIDEIIDEDDATDEQDHVKILEQTIANLTRHLPSTVIVESDSKQIHCISELSIQNQDCEIDMPTAMALTDEFVFSTSPTETIDVTLPMLSHSRQTNLSRSSGVRQNLTDLLTSTSHPGGNQTLQPTLPTHHKVIMN